VTIIDFLFFSVRCCEHLWEEGKCIGPERCQLGTICTIVAFVWVGRLGMKCCSRYLTVYKRKDMFHACLSIVVVLFSSTASLRLASRST
jgi:hypothetical protein